MSTPFDPERHARVLAPAGAVLCLAATALADWRGALLALVGLCLLLFACVSRRDGLLVVGPFARWELVRAARHKFPPALWRALYAAAVLVLLGLMYSNAHSRYWGFNQRPGVVMERVAVTFFAWFAVCQFLYLAALTVVLVAPVVAEERERKQLDFLLVTDLRNREILVGKAAGRVPRLLDPVLASLPVLALMPLFGGVPPEFVLAAAVATLATVLSLAGVSLYCSVKSENRGVAIAAAAGGVSTYISLSGALWLLALWPAGFHFPASVGVASPVEVQDVVKAASTGNPLAWAVRCAVKINAGADPQATVLRAVRWYAVFQVAAFGVFGLLAAARLRHAEVWTPAAKAAQKAAAPPLVRPPVGDEPLTWHEQFRLVKLQRIPTRRRVFWGAFLAGVIVVALMHLVPVFFPRAQPSVVKGLVNVAAGGVCIGAMMGAAGAANGTVARERKSDTLEALMLTGLGCREILRQKWRGCVLVLWPVYVVLLGMAAAGVATGKIHPLSAVLALLALPIQTAAATSFGLALGVRAKNPDRAAGVLLGAAVLILIAAAVPLGVLGSLLPVSNAGAVASGFVVLLPPLATAVFFGIPASGWYARGDIDPYAAFAAAVVGTLLCGRLAAWLFEWAVRRFEREWEGRA